MAVHAQTSLDSVLERALADSNASSSQDAVIVALHSNLLSAGFVCVAVGDEGFGGESVEGQEAVSTKSKPQLPIGWNATPDVCSLQYRHKATQQTCLLKAIPMGVQLLVSAVVASQMDRVVSLMILPSKYVKETSTYNSTSIFTNLLELMSTLTGEIQAKLTSMCEPPLGVPASTPQGAPQSRSAPRLQAPGNAVEVLPDRHFPAAIDPLRPGPSSRPNPLDMADPLRIGPPRRPVGDPHPLGELGPFGYGDRDRLPFGGGGGGMMFDPRHNPGMRGRFPGVGPLGPYPPGHPPGARFDPVSPLRPQFRPPGPRNPPGMGQYGPDPDHLPPPGYDDMFS